MLTFTQLNQAQPDLILELARASDRRADRLEDLAMTARNTVRDRINDPAVWEGAAATAAYEHTNDAVKTIFVQADCERAVAAVQRSSGNEIDAAQTRLRNVASRAMEAGLIVGPDGTITVPEVSWHPGGRFHTPQAARAEVARLESLAVEVQQEFHDALGAATRAADQLGSELTEQAEAMSHTERAVARMQRAAAAGEQAGERLESYLQRSAVPPQRLLQEIRARADSEAYAAALANELGARGWLTLAEQLPVESHSLMGSTEGLSPQQYDRFMHTMGHVLGTATNGAGPELSAEVKDALIQAAGSTETITVDGTEVREATAMAQLVKYGTGHLEGQFLADVAESVYQHRDELSTPGMVPTIDPMSTVIGALGESPQAARLFFDPGQAGGDLSRVDTLIEESYGAELTEALKDASTQFPPGDPDRSTEAAQRGMAIASHFLRGAASAEEGLSTVLGFGEQAEQMRQRDIASVMAYYYEDVQDALSSDPGSDFEPGFRHNDDRFSHFAYGANISQQDATALLGEVWNDEVARHRLIGAAGVYAEAELQERLAEGSPPEEATAGAMNEYGKAVGRMVGAAYGEQISEAQQQEIFETAGQALLGLGTVAAGPAGVGAGMVASGLSAAAGGLLDGAGAEPAELIEQRGDEIADTRLRAQAGITEMLIRNGQWPADQMPPEHLFHDGHFDVDSQREAQYLQGWLAEKSGITFDGKGPFTDGLTAGSGQYA